MKKILAMILALTMILSMAACGASNEEPKATEPAVVATQPTATEPVVQEPKTNAERYPLSSDKSFDVVAGSDIFGDDGETVITAAMEKATGVDIDWSYLTAEQIQLALTGKDLPDAIFLYASIMDKATMYEYGQGATSLTSWTTWTSCPTSLL
jgi:ABC-type glycerol-3-phosphate transport system substrate-binding protein